LWHNGQDNASLRSSIATNLQVAPINCTSSPLVVQLPETDFNRMAQ
jgi:hypothetical protein